LHFWSKITGKLASLHLAPQTRLARVTLYLAGIELLLLLIERLLKFVGAANATASLGGWLSFLAWVLCVLVLVLALRWFRNHVMWSVRNRLIVTYLFIGGVPVTLAAALAFGSGYLAVRELATFLAFSEIQTYQRRLGASNAAAAEQIVQHGGTPDKIVANDTAFPGRTVQILDEASTPTWLKDGFSELVTDHGRFYLRAANSIHTSHGPAMVVSSVPFDEKLLAKIASKLGSLTLSAKDVDIRLKDDSGISTSSTPVGRTSVASEQSADVTAGSVASPLLILDLDFYFGEPIPTVDWATNKKQPKILAGTTRLSTIYLYLTASRDISTGNLGLALMATAVAFALFVLIALIIGMRLTRTITYSVANLYKSTQHINRGDFTQRIQVRQKDQLAALQTAFNSMTDSLQQLIAEQKEKERLQSELEIAHEVQAQLFPQANSSTSTLELYGICRPARIVSGDYYDFLPYGPEQVGIAVGDISGKGISAALLMATIHSAIRAYEQEQLLTVGVAAAYGTNARMAAIESSVAPASPSQMLWLLNRHLYQSTQPEKYATLFLGFYDDVKHRLTYSNAGHLPPIILGQNGSVRRLETGGTVVGLFQDRTYDEETVELYPGDVFIAFSDGITEPENEFGEFGEDRLIETIAAYRHLPLERISDQTLAAVQDWIGSTEQPDDITLVLARCI